VLPTPCEWVHLCLPQNFSLMTLQDLQHRAQVSFKTCAVRALRLESSMSATGCTSDFNLGSFSEMRDENIGI
jgi:hypothetical protein